MSISVSNVLVDERVPASRPKLKRRVLVRIIALVVPLGFDTLAVALALGLRGIDPLRPALVFTAFETIMPIAGMIVGRFAGDRFAAAAAILGGVVLIVVGALTFREGRESADDADGYSFGSLKTAAAAGIGISLDELAVGFPLGTAHIPLGFLLLAIACQTFGVSIAGILIGRRVGRRLGRRASRYANLAAALAFTVVGAWLIVEAVMSPSNHA